jgi:vacuolar iron transporter family protein
MTRPPDGVGHYLRDLVYGASDGVVTTLAVVAGVAGADFAPRVGVVLGVSNLVADGLSMAVSNYLGLKSELEQAEASVDDEQPWRHGLATFAAFVAVGAVPLLAYLVGVADRLRLPVAFGLAMVALAVVGGARARFVARPAWRCALEMMVLAGGAAVVAYAIGAGLDAALAAP